MTHPTTPDNVWHTKIAARIHDPAEKALVLMRDPAGHENGTSLALSRLMGLRNYSETGDADHVIHAHRDRTAAFTNHGRQSALRSLGRQLGL